MRALSVVLASLILGVGCKNETIVESPPLITPELSIIVQPHRIHLGDSVTVSWTSQKAIKCYFNSTTEVPPNGSLGFRPSTKAVYAVTAVSKDGINVTASDSVQLDPWRFSITASTSGQGGSINKDPDSTNYVEGSVVKLTAIPWESALFVNWAGDATGSTNPVNLTMNGYKTVTAVFRQKQYFNISLTIQGNGRVTVSPDTSAFREGSQVTLTAVPDPGYGVKWGVDVSGYSNQVVLLMNTNKSVTATFRYMASNLSPRFLSLNVPTTITRPGSGSSPISFFATVNDPNGRTDIDSVYFTNLSSSAPSAILMYDDGDLTVHGDSIVADGTYSRRLSIDATTSTGPKLFRFSVVDQFGARADTTRTISIN